MKKHLLSLLAAVALLASACSGDDEAAVTDPVAPDSGEVATQKPVIMARTGLNATRTTLSSDGKKLLWDEDDALTVFLKNDHPELYHIYMGQGTSEGYFEPGSYGLYTPGTFKHYVAVDPFNLYSIQENSDKTGYVIGGTFNGCQFYRDFNPRYVPGGIMIGLSENAYDIKFKNVCGLLKLSFTAREEGTKINQIIVTGRNNETVSGDFEVNVGNNGEFTDVKLSNNRGEDNLVCLDFFKAFDLEVGKYADFYISMMPMDFSKGIEVKISTDFIDYKFKTKPFTMKSGVALVMPGLELSEKDALLGDITLITDEDAY